jgi:hypothetical protein
MGNDLGITNRTFVSPSRRDKNTSSRPQLVDNDFDDDDDLDIGRG